MATDRERASELARAVLEDPDGGMRYLPVLLESLEHDDPGVRITAAWTVCAVALSRPDDAAFLRNRTRTRDSPAATHAASWIDTVLDPGAEPSDGDEPERGAGDAPDGRSEGAAGSVVSGVGAAGGASGADPVAVVDPDDDGDPQGGADPDAGQGESDPDGPDGERDGDDGSGEPDTPESPGESGGFATADREGDDGGPELPDRVVEGDELAVESAIDPVEFLEQVGADGHTRTYHGLGVLDGQQEGVVVRTYVPHRETAGVAFSRQFRAAMGEWETVDDLPGVATVYDWGDRPHPWAVIEHAARSLWAVESLSHEAAFRTGLTVATAVAGAHGRGVVHGTLAPRSVVFDRGRSARVIDFGVGTALADAGGPYPMDRRYAAPELFDDDYGGIDWMTDIYHLGTLLYSLFTGRVPPRRDAGGERDLPAPTDVDADLPAAADRVVAKATADLKIARFESADEVARELRDAIDDRWGGE